MWISYVIHILKIESKNKSCPKIETLSCITKFITVGYSIVGALLSLFISLNI